MGRVITFGEIMLRLAPPDNLRFTQASRFEATYGGGEANVALSLAQLGEDASFVTKLPANDIGQAALNTLRQYGVGTEHIVRGGSRLGVYYLEYGASQRPSKVLYDRAHSAIAEASLADFDWESILEGASWFHFTGITPALKGNLPDICEAACRAAKAKGLTVSCDLNYRKKLWTRSEARAVMTRLMNYVDICVANEEDAKDVFGIEAEDTDITGGKLSRAGYEKVAERLTETFGFSAVGITLRTSVSASDNVWAGMLYSGGKAYFSRSYNVHIVDRVGGGDSFAAGLIYALLRDEPPAAALEFAVAASCLKHSIKGDFNLVSAGEAHMLASGDGSGRVQR